MKHFYIVANSEKGKTVEFAEILKQYIEGLGGTAVISRNEIFGNGIYTDEAVLPPEIQCVIALGGDGTIIQTARDLVNRQLPILGINLGTLGYLAQIEQEEYENALDALFADDFRLEQRIMLYGEIYRDGECIYKNLGVNDIVLSRGGNSRIVEFDFSVNGEFLNRYQADGMILSTPTGSTAYNLSAGGPIVMPEAEIIVATPINPHSLNARSIVLPADVEISLKIGEKSGSPSSSMVNFDASVCPDIVPGDEIRIRKSEKKATFIQLKKESFLETLRKKMNS